MAKEKKMSRIKGITEEELALFQKADVALYERVQQFITDNTDELNGPNVTFVASMSITTSPEMTEQGSRTTMNFVTMSGKGTRVNDLIGDLALRHSNRKLYELIKGRNS